MSIDKYQLWCNTDGKHEEVLSSTVPTQCPTNPEHSIDSASIVIMERAVEKKDEESKFLSLDDCKQIWRDQIDAKTDSLIAAGFTYDSNSFSLSIEAQSTWNGMFSAKTYLTYPMEVSTKVGGAYNLADATAVTNFFLTGVTAIKDAISSGRSLKVAVNAATTIAEVEAIVDPR